MRNIHVRQQASSSGSGFLLIAVLLAASGCASSAPLNSGNSGNPENPDPVASAPAAATAASPAPAAGEPQPASKSEKAEKPAPAGTERITRAPPGAATAAAATAVQTESYAPGDAAFRQRNIPAEAQKALELFRGYHQRNPQDPEAGWRRSMGCYFAGLHLATDNSQKEALFAEGREAGLAALARKPECAPCHFWTAINMALYGQTVGVFKMVFSLSAIKGHLEKSVALEPGYAGAGAYRLLGLIDQKLPGILGGSNDRAKQYFEKAIQQAPDEPLNYLFLTKLLSQEFDDVTGAVGIARKGLAVPRPSAERVESLGSIKELEEFLSTQGGTR